MPVIRRFHEARIKKDYECTYHIYDMGRNMSVTILCDEYINSSDAPIGWIDLRDVRQAILEMVLDHKKNKNTLRKLRIKQIGDSSFHVRGKVWEDNIPR